MKDVLIIGIGAGRCGDGGLGTHVIRKLRQSPVDGVRLEETDGEGTALIRLWSGHDSVIVIDAFSSGSTPGLLHALDASIASIPRSLFRASPHSFGLVEAIELSRRMEILPETLLVCGIEGRRFTRGTELSGVVSEKLGALIEVILEKVSEFHHVEVRSVP